jgi:hypothetical protein
MQPRNVISHTVVIGLLIAVGLGIFQAVGAASDPSIASSTKFAGPTEPPSSWYSNGTTQLNPAGRTAIAVPANGAGLVVQSATYTGVDTFATTIQLFADSQTDADGTCKHTVGPTGTGFFDVVIIPTEGTITKDFAPGISIPPGDELCALTNGNNTIVSLTGYNIPGKFVAQPTLRLRAVPNIR